MDSPGSKRLARFLTSRRQYSSKHKAVKPRAFLPSNGELSVFCVADLAYSEIVPLGGNLNLPPGRRLHGHAILASDQATDAGLTLDRDDTPFRHANIVGWPPEKDRQLAIAQELAASSDLFLHRVP